jgi:hypothetical protein
LRLASPALPLLRYLKAPPYKDMNLMTMRDGNGWINCGVVYAQNARPDGPTAYALGEVIDRTLRWGEDFRHLSAHVPPHASSCWEQTLYSDTVMSAVAGRPIFHGCWDPPGEPSK